jgi:hypothetical protein
MFSLASRLERKVSVITVIREMNVTQQSRKPTLLLSKNFSPTRKKRFAKAIPG